MLSVEIIKRARTNKNGSHPLQLKLTLNRRSSRLNIGVNIESRYWNDETQSLKKNHPDYRVIQTTIADKISQANKVALLLETELPDFTLAMLKVRLTGKKSYKQTFFSQADEFFETLILAGKVNRAQGEKPALNHFKNFVNGRDLAFEDVTFTLLTKFIAYLEGLGTVGPRSIMNYLAMLRSIYSNGIHAGHVKQSAYPFGKGEKKIKIKYPVSLKIGLDAWEVEAIEKLDLQTGSFIDHARNVWLFSFYFAGMRVSDVLMLKWSELLGDRLHYTMGKNNKPVSVIIPPKAKLILNHYAQMKCLKTNLVFPDMRDAPSLTDRRLFKPIIKNRNKKLNKYLKQVAALLEIQKPLTMHIARHSFGNIAGDKIPLLTLQKLYRHSSITTTVNYQRAFMNKSSDDALLSVVNFTSHRSKKNKFVRVS